MPQTLSIHLTVRLLYATFNSYALLFQELSCINTYRNESELFIEGNTLHSQEGTTQGDPLAMAMYAIAITPLIYRLENAGIKQAWYADDATAGGSLQDLREWCMGPLSAIGPRLRILP